MVVSIRAFLHLTKIQKLRIQGLKSCDIARKRAMLVLLSLKISTFLCR